MADMIRFKRPDGGKTQGYLSRVENASSAIIVLQEWWGLNEQIRGVVERFADAGYSALAPDLYAGRVAQDPDEASHMMDGLDWVGATEQDVSGALSYLKDSHDKVAVMGFCMGGALSIIAGVKLDNCDGVVCYYGIPPVEQADPAAMRVPFQGHFASRDDWCTPQAVDALKADLERSGVVYELNRYEGDHAFFNETSEAYNFNAAALSWTRSLEFLGKYL